MNGLRHFCLLAVCLMGLVGSVWADIGNWNGSDPMLYWMIDNSNEIVFEYAVVYAAETKNLEGRTWTPEEGFGEVAVALPTDLEGGAIYSSLAEAHTTTIDFLTELGAANSSSYSFYIELLQWDEAANKEIRKGVSVLSTYDDLLSSHHILGSGLTIPSNLEVWTPTINSVPEPSAGMLLLLGCAWLGLRRRRHGG